MFEKQEQYRHSSPEGTLLYFANWKGTLGTLYHILLSRLHTIGNKWAEFTLIYCLVSCGKACNCELYCSLYTGGALYWALYHNFQNGRAPHWLLHSCFIQWKCIYLVCFVHWKDIPEGSLSHFSCWKGIIEGISSIVILQRTIQWGVVLHFFFWVFPESNIERLVEGQQ